MAQLVFSHLLRFHRLNPNFPFFVNFAIGTTSPSVNPGKVYAANSVSGDISAFTSAPSTGVLMGYPWVNLGDSDVEWPAVRAAFAEIGYAGSVIAELEPGDEAYLRDVSRRIDRLLLDRA
jgi:hypothetical protein